jgi:hypothetical protein
MSVKYSYTILALMTQSIQMTLYMRLRAQLSLPSSPKALLPQVSNKELRETVPFIRIAPRSPFANESFFRSSIQRQRLSAHPTGSPRHIQTTDVLPIDINIQCR